MSIGPVHLDTLDSEVGSLAVGFVVGNPVDFEVGNPVDSEVGNPVDSEGDNFAAAAFGSIDNY